MTLDSSSGLDVPSPFHVLVFQSGLLFNISYQQPVYLQFVLQIAKFQI